VGSLGLLSAHMVGMDTTSNLHAALQAAINAPDGFTKAQLVGLLEKHPAPAVPSENDLVIRDGILSVDQYECTCTASDWNAPEGCSHEYHCGLEPLLDISRALERGGYRA
jgi:hypothetical protein